MKRWILRFGICLFFAFLLSPLIITNAQIDRSRLEQDETDNSEPDCLECHWLIYITWEKSTHGQGLSCGQCHLGDQDNHAREGHWTQGGPQECMGCHTTGYNAETDTWEEDGIHCKVCHSPINLKHPEEPMPTDHSAELCGQCHIEAHFEWRVSAHGEAEVVCVSCHNQHATSLKGNDIVDQCANCHEIMSASYLQSAHGGEGLTCASCHLATVEGPIAEGMAKRNHTFSVALATCVKCHDNQLHSPGEGVVDAKLIQDVQPDGIDAMSSNIMSSVSESPMPTNPAGFVLAGGVTAGLALRGVVLRIAAVMGPRLSQWYGRILRKRQQGDHHE